jgi:hypothetical protein
MLLVLGCGSPSQDQESAELAAIRAGTLKMLSNPSPTVISEMADDPQAAAGVTDIWFQDAKMADPEWSAVSELAALPGLKLIRCYNTQDTDEFAEVLTSLPQITSLAFHETDLSDAGLIHVAKMSKLQDLVIEFKRGDITDAGLASLASLKNLKTLRISTDESLSASKLTSSLPNCKVTVERYSSAPAKAG